MSHQFVFASAESRLHADLIVVRLKRAGIATSEISLLYPDSLQPNSALCWLPHFGQFSLAAGGEIMGSGSFGNSGNAHAQSVAADLAQKLESLGLTPDQEANIEEILSEGRIVVAVEARNKKQLQDVFETLRLVGVENLLMASRDFSSKIAA